MINLRVARAPLVVSEVPSYESERLHGVSNLNAFHDGLRILGVILRERFRWSDVIPLAHQPRHALPSPHAHKSEAADEGNLHLLSPTTDADADTVTLTVSEPPAVSPRVALDLTGSTDAPELTAALGVPG